MYSALPPDVCTFSRNAGVSNGGFWAPANVAVHFTSSPCVSLEPALLGLQAFPLPQNASVKSQLTLPAELGLLFCLTSVTPQLPPEIAEDGSGPKVLTWRLLTNGIEPRLAKTASRLEPIFRSKLNVMKSAVVTDKLANVGTGDGPVLLNSVPKS